MSLSSPPPIHVPTLTEVIEPDAPLVESPILMSEPALVVAPLSVEPFDPADVHEVPRNLLRPEAASMDVPVPPPMTAAVAAPSSTRPSSAALEAARASLSDALRSARDGRWAPMSNVELPTLDAVLDLPSPAESIPAASSAQMELPQWQPAVAPVAPPAQPEPPLAMAAEAVQTASVMPEPVEVTEVTESQLAHRVLSVVQKQVDGLIDFRLREALSPILQRHADALVRDLRDELKQTMQDVVNRAVAQEMAKVRQR